MFSQVCVCSTLGGGGGSYPIPGLARGGTPSQVWPGGYPIPGLAGGGVPHPSLGRGYPGYPPTRSGWGPPGPGTGYPPDLGQSTPQTWDRIPPPPDLGWGTPPLPTRSGLDRAAQRVLATRRAMCLLRSRRRTFLLAFLMTTYVVRGKVMFSDVSVLLFTGGTGGTLTQPSSLPDPTRPSRGRGWVLKEGCLVRTSNEISTVLGDTEMEAESHLVGQ